MDSFFLMGAKPLVQDSPTMKLHELLDWAEIAHKLKGLYKREATHGGGPEPYSPLAMFKLMLLGQWHGLSDTQLEHALKVRLDFMVFAGFEPGVAASRTPRRSAAFATGWSGPSWTKCYFAGSTCSSKARA